jgi:hypothetical protein
MDSPELPDVDTPKETLSYQKAYQIEYHKKNKEKNREKYLEKCRNLTAEQREEISISKALWYQENKEAVKLKEYKRYWKDKRRLIK